MKPYTAIVLSVFTLPLGFLTCCSRSLAQTAAPATAASNLNESSQPANPQAAQLWNEWVGLVDDRISATVEECAAAVKQQGIFVSKVFESVGILVMITKDKDAALFSNISCLNSVEFSGVVDVSGIAGISN